MRPNPQETADLVTFTEEILNGKLHFLCSDEKQTTPSNHNTLYMTSNMIYLKTLTFY